MIGSAARSFPTVVPVFAVPGTILLPGGRVPLVVFEPRYLAMVDDALGAGRLFGLVQPFDAGGDPVTGLHPVGTLSRIAAWARSCDQTGGDYYAFLAPQADRRDVVIGDVSGHGPDAAALGAGGGRDRAGQRRLRAGASRRGPGQPAGAEIAAGRTGSGDLARDRACLEASQR